LNFFGVTETILRDAMPSAIVNIGAYIMIGETGLVVEGVGFVYIYEKGSALQLSQFQLSPSSLVPAARVSTPFIAVSVIPVSVILVFIIFNSCACRGLLSVRPAGGSC
jgi:hypothetical protein